MGGYDVIVQDIYIQRYAWNVRVFYAVTAYWADDILSELRRIGCRGEEYVRARHNLYTGSLDTGLTYSNFRDKESVVVIGLTSSPEEFMNSFEHEKGHLCRHISQSIGLDPYGEETQYLSGEVSQLMFPVARKFLCAHCRKEIYGK